MSLRTVSVRVKDQPTVVVDSVTYDNNITVKLNSDQNYKVRNIAFTSGGAKRLSDLLDVTVTNAQQDDTLLYNEDNSKWENKKVNLDFGEY